MMHRLDLWLGKRLFIPIAIRLCQLLKVSQYALHTYIWLVVMFYNLSLGPHAMGGWAMYTIIALVTLLWVVIAGLVPEWMKTSSTWLRYMFIFFFCMDFVLFALLVISHEHLIRQISIMVKDWWILVAEYALVITHVPPLEKKAKKESTKLVRQKA